MFVQNRMRVPASSLVAAALFVGALLTSSSLALAATAGATANKAKAAQARAAARNGPVELYAVNGKETLQLRLRDDKGRPLRGVQKRFDHFLRCHHTNTQHAMNPRLVRVLYQVGRHYPGRRIEVVSGYRHPSVAKNPRSPHMKGLACDFRVIGVKNAELRDYLRRAFDKVGVGYYPNSSFVHLDMRKDRSAFWIDYSGPGERAVYSENPGGDLRSGRADTYKPTKIDARWASDPDDPGDDAPPPSLVPPAYDDEASETPSAPSRVAVNRGAPAAAETQARERDQNRDDERDPSRSSGAAAPPQ